jgi:uncharacterized membrane protein
VLFLFGLPIFLVFLSGGLVLGALFAALAVGLVALKVALVVMLLYGGWRLARKVWRETRGAR